MLIYVNITDRQTDGQTDKLIKSIIRNLTKIIVDFFARIVSILHNLCLIISGTDCLLSFQNNSITGDA
jgi:hypothetical protein